MVTTRKINAFASPQIFVIVAFLFFFSKTGAAENVKDGYGFPENHIGHTTHQYFSKLVEMKTSGKLKVDVFPNQQLGADRDLVEGVRLGTIQITSAPPAIFANVAKLDKLQITNFPFLFPTREVIYAFWKSPIGKQLSQEMETAGFKFLGDYDIGWIQISTKNKIIRKPEDLKGLKIRTFPTTIDMAAVKSLGANPTPIAFGELYTSLQQGVVDGTTAVTPMWIKIKLHEVQKYLTLIDMVMVPHLLVANKKWFDGQPNEIKQALIQAGEESAEYNHKIAMEEDREIISELKKVGMQVITLSPSEKQSFVEAARPVYKEFIPKVGDEFYKNVETFIKTWKQK